MAKIKQSPKLPAPKRRKQLLKSAQRLFVKKGYRDTTTEEIAQSTGLTKGAVYFHFKNKEDILYELVKEVTGKYVDMFDHFEDGQAHPVDFLRLVFDTKYTLTPNDLASSLDFWVEATSIPRIRRYLNARDNDFIRSFARKVNPSYVRGSGRAKEIAVLLISVADGLLVKSILHRRIVDVNAQLDLLNELFDSRKNKQKRTGKGTK